MASASIRASVMPSQDATLWQFDRADAHLTRYCAICVTWWTSFDRVNYTSNRDDGLFKTQNLLSSKFGTLLWALEESRRARVRKHMRTYGATQYSVQWTMKKLKIVSTFGTYIHRWSYGTKNKMVVDESVCQMPKWPSCIRG